jgi:hypothetical protein
MDRVLGCLQTKNRDTTFDTDKPRVSLRLHVSGEPPDTAGVLIPVASNNKMIEQQGASPRFHGNTREETTQTNWREYRGEQEDDESETGGVKSDAFRSGRCHPRSWSAAKYTSPPNAECTTIREYRGRTQTCTTAMWANR